MIASRRTAPTSRPAPGDGVPSSRWSLPPNVAAPFKRAIQATAFWRITAVVICVVAAYNFSLQTLVQEMGQQTPLAYLGLVPLIALLLAVVLALRRASGPDIHDRYLDYIIGVPLVTLAMGLVIVAPQGLPSVYWLHRLDLLSLPLFVAGAISLSVRRARPGADSGSSALSVSGLAISVCRLSRPRAQLVHRYDCFGRQGRPACDTGGVGGAERRLPRIPCHGTESKLHGLGQLRVFRDQQRTRLPARRHGRNHPDARPSCSQDSLASGGNRLPVRWSMSGASWWCSVPGASGASISPSTFFIRSSVWR